MIIRVRRDRDPEHFSIPIPNPDLENCWNPDPDPGSPDPEHFSIPIPNPDPENCWNPDPDPEGPNPDPEIFWNPDPAEP
jgi:hypothetical protein